MSAQPARQLIRAPRHFAIDANARNAAEVLFVWGGRPVRRSGNNSQIDGTHISLVSTKDTPRREGIPNSTQIQCPRKVIAASCGNNEHRQCQPGQLSEVAMYRSVAAKEKNGLSFI